MSTPDVQFTFGSYFCGNQQFAVRAIERIAETVAVEMGQQLAGLSVDRLIGEDHLVDAVIVPLVVGRHLVDPLRHAVVGIAGEDGHRPLVVAGPLLRVPGRGIARAVIDEIERRVVGDPAPCAAAADLPLIAFPGLGARILADRLAERRCLVGVDEDLIVRTFRVGLPGLLAVLDVVGSHAALDAELAARNADQNLVLDHERRRGAGLSLGRIAVDCGPLHVPVLASSATSLSSA